MAEKVPQEHIDALKETERLKAEGKAEYISYDELKKTMDHVLKEIKDAPVEHIFYAKRNIPRLL